MPRKEIWDGSRFAVLSWFWDPDKEGLLPFKCPSCSSVISAVKISEYRMQPNTQIDQKITSNLLPLPCIGYVQGEVSCTRATRLSTIHHRMPSVIPETLHSLDTGMDLGLQGSMAVVRDITSKSMMTFQ